MYRYRKADDRASYTKIFMVGVKIKYARQEIA